jgi:hypothetical protein
VAERWLRARLWTLRHERGLTRAGIRRAAALWWYSYDAEEHPQIDRFRLLAGLTHADMAAANRIVRELDIGGKVRLQSRKELTRW